MNLLYFKLNNFSSSLRHHIHDYFIIFLHENFFFNFLFAISRFNFSIRLIVKIFFLFKYLKFLSYFTKF